MAGLLCLVGLVPAAVGAAPLAFDRPVGLERVSKVIEQKLAIRRTETKGFP